MKKLIVTTLTLLLATFGLIYAEESADADVDVDVDVVVEQPSQPTKPQINVDEILKIVEKRLEKAGFTNEQIEQIIAKIKEKIEQGEVPPVQLAVKVCEKAELGAWNKDTKKCEKDIEATAKMLKKQIAEAKAELEKEAKKYSKNKKPEVPQQPNKPITTKPIDEQKPEKPIKQPKAVDVLESLVEQGIPVEHALNVVKEAMKGKEGDVDIVAREKIVQEIREGKINLPVELKEKIREQLQFHVQTQTQLQNQMLEQKLQLQTYQGTQTQLQLQNQYQYQLQNQYQQYISGETSGGSETYQQMMQQNTETQTQPCGSGETTSGGSETYQQMMQQNTETQTQPSGSGETTSGGSLGSGMMEKK